MSERQGAPRGRERARQRLLDDPEVVRYDFLQEFQKIIDEAVDKLTSALDEHKNDPYAHMAAANQYRSTYAQTSERMGTLWDERNEMKGMIKVWLPVLGIVGPIVAGLVVVILVKALHI